MFLRPVAWWRIIALIVAGVSFGALSPSVPIAPAAKQCVVAGTGRPLEEIWRPNMVRAMLMVAYMNRPATAGRALTRRDKWLFGPMIRRSDNIAAQRVFDTVGQSGLRALARRVGMARFATDPVWGKTRVSARDQTKSFLHLASYIVPAHRSYAMRLLRSIVPGER